MGGGNLKNKNAFTLIELLAIIVILAIIAVITVPIILNIIENSRLGAVKDSAYGYKDAINKYYVTELANNRQLQLDGEYTIENGVLKGDDIEDTNIPVSGTIPSSGTLTYSNNTLTEGCLVIGEYAVTFDGGTVSKTQKGECKKITLADTMTKGIKEGNVQYYTGGDGATADNSDNIVFFDPINGTKNCTTYHIDNSTTGFNGVTIGTNSTKTTDNQTSCLKWFIYSIDDKGTSSETDDVVNMILDHNTTRCSNNMCIEWISSNHWTAAPTNSMVTYADGTLFSGASYPDNIKGPLTVLSKLQSEVSEWTSDKLITPNSYSTSWTNNGIEKNYTIKYTTKARLIEANEVARIKGDSSWDYKTASSDLKTNNYNFLTANLSSFGNGINHGYWTSSPCASDSYSAWNVFFDGVMNKGNTPNSDRGVRPVISVLKSDIL